MTEPTHEVEFTRLKRQAERLLARIRIEPDPMAVVVILEAILEERRHAEEVLLLEVERRLDVIYTRAPSPAPQAEGDQPHEIV